MVTKGLSLLLRLRESASGHLSWTSAVLLHYAYSFDCWKPFTSLPSASSHFPPFSSFDSFSQDCLMYFSFSNHLIEVCVPQVPSGALFPSRYTLLGSPLPMPSITLSVWGRSTCQSSLQGPERKDHPYSSELTRWLRLAYLNCSPCPTLTFSWPCLSTNTVSEPLHDKQGPSLYGTCECLTLIISKLHSRFLLWPPLTVAYQTNMYVLTTLRKGKKHGMTCLLKKFHWNIVAL